jgi:hypothetical protein
MTTHIPARPGHGTLAIAALLLAGIAVLALASLADAGTWALVSCQQPDGQPAPTDGWSPGAVGSPGFYTEGVNSCAEPGGALVALSSGKWVQPASSGYQWRFSAPAGSVIAGGQLDASLTAPHGITSVLTAEGDYDSANQIVVCGLSETCGMNASATTVAINHPGASGLYASAICFPFSEGCGETNGVNAQITLHWAHIELEANESPAGSGFSGGLLAPNASGVQNLVFTASVPTGPGIWRVTAAIDEHVVYDETPDLNSGKCKSIGTDPNGVPEFLYEQPCKQAETVSIPVNTSTLATGSHELSVTVTDAAGNSATVFDGTINTFNASSEVPWNVTLRVSPRHVHRHWVITLAGSVTATGRSASGKSVYLEARTERIVGHGRGRSRRELTLYGPWLTFQALTAKPDGVFSSSYRFRLGGRHRYQFRAVAPQEGAGSPPTTGTSAPVAVTET